MLIAEGLTDRLLWAGLCVWVIGFLIASRHLSIIQSLIVVSIKVAIPIIYFAYFYDGSWNFLDDFMYAEEAENLLKMGFNPIKVWFEPDSIKELETLANSTAILYYWWNMIGMSLFGYHYYSPVLLNVILTFVNGYIIVNTAKIIGFSKQYANLLLIFLLLHWDTITWSSFINLKDILVANLTILYFYLIYKSLLGKEETSQHNQIYKFVFLFAGIAFLMLSFNRIRSYVFYVLVLTTFIWFFHFRKVILSKTRYFFNIFILVLLLIVGFPFIKANYEQAGIALELASIPYGMLRMILTPQPWSIEPDFMHLYIPSLLHWLFLPLTFLGGLLLWQSSREMRLLILYLMISIMFYGSFDLLQGPRHRIQISFIVAWIQFHACWVLLTSVLEKSYPRRS